MDKLLPKFRAKHNLTLREASKILGFSAVTLSKWENGKMRPSNRNRFVVINKMEEYNNGKDMR